MPLVPTTPATPRRDDLPLAVRVQFSRAIAYAVAVLCAAAWGLVLLVPEASSLDPSLVLLVTGALALTMLVLAAAPWPDRLGRTGQEVVLVVQAVAGIAAVLSGVTATPSPDSLGIVYLPLAILLASALLPLRTQVLVVLLTLVVATPLLLGAAIGLGGVWAIFAAAATGCIGALSTTFHARALARARRSTAAAEHATAALEVVVDAAAAAAVSDPDDVLEAVVTAATRLDADVVGIHVVGPDGRVTLGADSGDLPPPMGVVPTGLVRSVLASGQVEQRAISTYDRADARYRGVGLGSVLGVPVRVRGEVVGVLVAGRRSRDAPPGSAVHAMQLLAEHAGRALALSRQIDDDRRTLRHLRQLQAQQEDFVATVSHELRTPVTVVDGLVRTILDHDEELDDAQRRIMLERLAANSASLRGIVTSLLDSARLDKGLEAAHVVLDLSALVLDSVDRLAPLLSAHVLDLLVTPGIHVRGDAALLQRVVDNLLTNALQHTPAGTRVTVTLAQLDGEAIISVDDDGPGIPADELPTLTRRFVRGTEAGTRRHRGLGIGLALVTQVLRLHGTRLTIQSDEGRGTQFSFALPSVESPVEDRGAGTVVVLPDSTAATRR